jgi:hypothetical protein
VLVKSNAAMRNAEIRRRADFLTKSVVSVTEFKS